MKKLFILALASIAFASCSQDRITGSGSTTTETRSVNNFTGVSTSGSTGVDIIQGATFRVEVSGYNNLLPYLETVVINNVLQVRYKNNVNIRHDNTHVTITMPQVNYLSISGSANIDARGNFTAINEFQSRISGSGSISIEKGTAKNFRSEISGSGDVNAFGLQVETANVKISGSGNTHVTATSNLNVEIAGSGNVYYKGSPSVFASVSGSGKVQKQ